MKKALVCGLAGIILTSAVTAWAGTAFETLGPDPSPGRRLAAFVNSDGRIDLEALRASDYQGPLQLDGARIRIDPVTAELRVQPAVTSDPDDAHWSNSLSPVLAGLNGYATALTVYDHKLIAAGRFTVAGGTKAMNIAAWDGSSWSPLGAGLNDEVFALAVYGDRLIAGGQFSSAGGVAAKKIAAWDGNSWSALGAGIDGLSVTALAVYDDQLIAGGYFVFVADGHALRNIAAWNGESWTSLGLGIDNAVLALTVFENRLIAGGYFTTAGSQPSTNNIAAWDGTSWAPLAGGLDRYVNTLCVYDNTLVAGGHAFSFYGIESGIAAWNGTTWTSLVKGALFDVYALRIFDGKLIIGGGPLMNASSGYVGAWDGTSWSDLGSGVGGRVVALSVYGDELIAGGRFTRAGDVSARFIAAWNRTRWSAMPSGTDGSVGALTVYRGRLIAGGSFTRLGRVRANHIAAWDGASWAPLGPGLDGGVDALTVYGDKLIAGGGFTRAGSVAAANIAAWDGNSWSALGAGFSIVSPIEALAVYDGELIAGGRVWWTDRPNVSLIAAWNGISWQTLGGGIPPNDPPYDAEYWDAFEVSALFVYEGRLIAAGSFAHAGGVPVQSIAVWDGVSWSALRGWLPNPPPAGHRRVGLHIAALVSYHDRLIAGGNIGVWVWNGDGWSAPGIGQVSGTATSLAVYGGRLIVAGDGLSVAGDDATRQIAAWDGTTWSNLGTGTNVGAAALTEYQGSLVAGGGFTIAGDRAAAYLAEWNKRSVRPAAVVRIETASRAAEEVRDFERFSSSPNPFQLSTQIAFDLPEAVHVRLDIFNVLGQRVTTLIDRAMEAGRRSVTWRADQVPPGVYYARLRSGETVHTWKMMVVR